MNSNNGGLIGLLASFGVASAVGFFAMAGLMVLGDWTLLQALFAAALIFAVLGSGLALIFSRPLTPPVKPGTAGMAYAAPEAATPTPTAPKSAPAPKAAPAAEAAPAPAPAPKADPAPAPEADKAEEAVAEEQPEILTGPRAGQEADDLKRISGVGPKLEGVLNELGFYHFDQIAAWTPEQVAWVDARLQFKGRIVRDNWIAQAAEFAKGD